MGMVAEGAANARAQAWCIQRTDRKIHGESMMNIEC
jgi:hypothetical protein